MTRAELSSCGQIVRAYDPDRFLLSLFAPSDRQEDLWALFAFNHEIAKTREVVSDSTLGLIRLQWWRDSLSNIYSGGRVPEHDILLGLETAIKNHDLPRESFDALAYAREFDLENVCPANLEGLLNYCDFTSTPLLKLAVQIAGGEADMEPVYPVAVNYALAGLLRSVSVHAGQERCYLPKALMDKHAVTKPKLYKFEEQAGLAALIAEIVAARTVGVKPVNAFLCAVAELADIHFNYLKRQKYNVYSSKYMLDPPFKALRLAVATKFIHF